MKTLFIAAMLATFSLCSFAQTQTDEKTNAPAAPKKIKAAEAKANIGKEVIIEAKVAEVNKAERLVRLNLEKPYPAQAMTAVIFSPKTNLFPEIEKLQGKQIELTGKISEYHGRPEMILTSTNQLKVVEKKEGKEEK